MYQIFRIVSITLSSNTKRQSKHFFTIKIDYLFLKFDLFIYFCKLLGSIYVHSAFDSECQRSRFLIRTNNFKINYIIKSKRDSFAVSKQNRLLKHILQRCRGNSRTSLLERDRETYVHTHTETEIEKKREREREMWLLIQGAV